MSEMLSGGERRFVSVLMLDLADSSALSSRLPSQQLGKVACSCSIASAPQAGMTWKRGLAPTAPQLHETIPFGCRVFASALPAIIMSPFGGAEIRSRERLT